MNKRKFKKKAKEVRKLMCCGKRKEKSNKGLWFGIILAVVAGLVGLVLWLKSRNDEYIEEYYEYFDDDLEDEFEDDLYGEDDDVEYVAIKDFAADVEEPAVEEPAVEGNEEDK
ncbi:MAG: hypothetical protein RR744_10105 [Cellulosilyticaceae bacterium]